MGLVERGGRRHCAAAIAHGAGAVSWWVFVVARLMIEVNSFGVPRRYATGCADVSIFGVDLGRNDTGWAIFSPLADPIVPISPFDDMNLLAGSTLTALAMTEISAVIEAVAVRRWPAGVLTIVTPIIGAAIILCTLDYSVYGSTPQLNATVVFMLVLLGVAVREVWSRVWAPRALRGESLGEKSPAREIPAHSTPAHLPPGSEEGDQTPRMYDESDTGKTSKPDGRRVRLANILTSVQGRIYAGAIVFGLAVFELYGYWRTGKPVLVLFAVFMLGLVAHEGVQIYRHRNDPESGRGTPRWRARRVSRSDRQGSPGISGDRNSEVRMYTAKAHVRIYPDESDALSSRAFKVGSRSVIFRSDPDRSTPRSGWTWPGIATCWACGPARATARPLPQLWMRSAPSGATAIRRQFGCGATPGASSSRSWTTTPRYGR